MYSTVNLQNEDENEKMFTFKVKSIPLNSRNIEKINAKVLLETVLEKPTNVITIDNPSKICRDKKKAILFTRPESKRWKIMFDKRIVDWNTYETKPYGFQN